ncbi:MAG: phage virion morphogenesis protein [Candidatus Kapabacteria bacterium]|nr:phage virion morphogenesis protein [Candidatus Kapabacteria bacterium]
MSENTKFRFEILADEARNAIRAMVAKEIDLYPFYNRVGKLLLTAVSKQFIKIGGYFPNNKKWEKLAPSTRMDRKRKGYTPIRILRRTAGDAGLLGSINYSASREGVTIGTNVPYAVHLHYGTRFMPARQIFPEDGLPDEVLEDIADAFLDFYVKVFK